MTTANEFALSRRSVALRSDKIAASNLAVAWSRCGLEESLVGGVLQGRRQFDEKGASAVSRRRLWQLARDICAQSVFGDGEIERVLCAYTYQQVKDSELLSRRRACKKDVQAVGLKGWASNGGDSDFALEKAQPEPNSSRNQGP